MGVKHQGLAEVDFRREQKLKDHIKEWCNLIRSGSTYTCPPLKNSINSGLEFQIAFSQGYPFEQEGGLLSSDNFASSCRIIGIETESFALDYFGVICF